MLSIGTTIYLENYITNEEKKYRAKIVDITSEGIFIGQPVNDRTSRTEMIISGEQFTASFIAKEQVCYAFSTEVLGKSFHEIPMILLSYPGDDQLVKIQRREYVRVDTCVDVSVHVGENRHLSFATVTHDLSAGGCALIQPEGNRLLPNMLIDLWIVLPFKKGNEFLKVKGRTIRIKERKGAPSVISVQFVDLQENARQRIVQFNFEQQTLFRKRQLAFEVE